MQSVTSATVVAIQERRFQHRTGSSARRHPDGSLGNETQARASAATALAPDAQVLTDGLACFAAVADVGCTHAAIKTGAGPRAAKTPAFNWVNTALGNIKAALVGTLLIRLVDSVARAVRANRNIPVRDRRAGGTLESPRPSDDGKRFSGVGSR